MLRLASWNVNGIRACHKSCFMTWFRETEPDVVGLQEVRAEEGQIPKEILEVPGYYKSWMPATSKKGYSGVGILSRREPKRVLRGMTTDEFDVEGRVIAAEFEEFIFVSAYFPNSQDKGARLPYKLKFCGRIHAYVDELGLGGKPVVLCGDYNIAHKRIDLARPDANEETPGFLPEERAWMDSFTSAGWVDTYRYKYPEKVEYSWWSARMNARARNVGWRIDYHAIPWRHRDLIVDASIQHQQLGSDHCPVWLKLNASL